MQITLYKNSSAPETLDKNIQQIGSTTAIAPTTAVNVLSPDIVLTYNATYLDCNYCYIDTFHRYYFCSITVDTANRLVLHCNVDPLMTYLSSIKNCPISVIRSETIGSNFVIDRQLPVDPSRYFIQGQFFPLSPLTYDSIVPGRRFIFLVNGG